jgi:hypothetical protein
MDCALVGVGFTYGGKYFLVSFLMCSHQVPKVFPKISQQHHMLWPNLNFHIYVNYKRGREGGWVVGKGKHKGASIGECSMFRKDLCWVNQIGSFKIK